MKHYTQAIKRLLSDAHLCSDVELLLRYSAAKVIFEEIMELLKEDDYEYLRKDSYATGKLRLSLTLFLRAAVSLEDGYSSLESRINSSRMNLDKFEGKISA